MKSFRSDSAKVHWAIILLIIWLLIGIVVIFIGSSRYVQTLPQENTTIQDVEVWQENVELFYMLKSAILVIPMILVLVACAIGALFGTEWLFSKGGRVQHYYRNKPVSSMGLLGVLFIIPVVYGVIVFGGLILVLIVDVPRALGIILGKPWAIIYFLCPASFFIGFSKKYKNDALRLDPKLRDGDLL